MSPPFYSAPKAPVLAGTPRGIASETTNHRPSTVFVLAFFGSLLLVSVLLCCIVYVWRKRTLAAADLEASRLAQEKAVAKEHEEQEYQELGEKLLGPADQPLKPLEILSMTRKSVHFSVYRTLALPRFVRNREAHNKATVRQAAKIERRPQWMPRPTWLKRSAMLYKRASTSRITLSDTCQWNAVSALKSSSSCPGGFQKHQFKWKNTSTLMCSDTPSQRSTTVTDRELTFGGVEIARADGKDQEHDLTLDGKGVSSVSELSDSDLESLSSTECVLRSAPADTSDKKVRSTLDKVANDLLSENLSEALADTPHSYPASELFQCASVRNERLSIWFDQVRHARCNGEDLIPLRTLPHLHNMKAISFVAKKHSTRSANGAKTNLLDLKRPFRASAPGWRRVPRRHPGTKLHMAVGITFSSSRTAYSSPFMSHGVRRSSNVILCSLGTVSGYRSRRCIGSSKLFGAAHRPLNVIKLDEMDLFPLSKPKRHDTNRTPTPVANGSSRTVLGGITNLGGPHLPHLIRPHSSPLLLVNGAVADEVSATKQISGLGDPIIDFPQDANMLSLTWTPKSAFHPITLKVTVKSTRPGFHSPYAMRKPVPNNGRALSGSLFSRNRHNQSMAEPKDSEVLHILDVTTYVESTFRDFREGVEGALGYRAYFRGLVELKGKEMYLPLLTEKHFRHWLDDRLGEGATIAYIDAWKRDDY